MAHHHAWLCGILPPIQAYLASAAAKRIVNMFVCYGGMADPLLHA